MQGKYVGNRPLKLRKSTWDDRTDEAAAAEDGGKGTKRPAPRLKHKPAHKRKHVLL